MAVLSPPVVFSRSASSPTAVFWEPVVLLWSASAPKAVLLKPVVLLWSAFLPPAVFSLWSLSMMFGGACPQLGATSSTRTREATTTALLQTLLIGCSSYGVQGCMHGSELGERERTHFVT